MRQFTEQDRKRAEIEKYFFEYITDFTDIRSMFANRMEITEDTTLDEFHDEIEADGMLEHIKGNGFRCRDGVVGIDINTDVTYDAHLFINTDGRITFDAWMTE